MGQGVQFAESRECTWMLLGIPQPVGPGMSRMFVVRIACPCSMGGTMELGGCARVGLFPSVPSLTARAPLRFKPIWRNGWGCHVIGLSRLTKPESLSRCYRISAFGIPQAQFEWCSGENARENSDFATRSRSPTHPPATRHLTPPSTPSKHPGLPPPSLRIQLNSSARPPSSPIYSAGSRLSNSRKTALILAFALALAARAR